MAHSFWARRTKATSATPRRTGWDGRGIDGARLEDRPRTVSGGMEPRLQAAGRLRLGADIATHALTVLRLFANQLMVMKDSRMLGSGLTAQVLDDPQRASTQLLVSFVMPVWPK